MASSYIAAEAPSAACSVSSHSPRKRRRTSILVRVLAVLISGGSAIALGVPRAATPRHQPRAASRRYDDSLYFRHHNIPRNHAKYDSIMRQQRVRYSSSTLYASLPENEDISKSGVSSAERSLGILVLCSVPLAWGTFEPAVRYVYAIKPAIPGFVFSVGYYLVATIALSSLASLSMTRQQTETIDDDKGESEASSSLPIVGGIELGTYLFLGNGLQVLGLKTVPSDRAAFLLQLTTIFVPLVQAVVAGNVNAISLKTWGACFIALSGVAVMGLDGAEVDDLASSFGSLTQGDLMIVAAALTYTFHCIRLGRYAKETSAIKLAACKATTETAWSLALVLSLVAFAGSNAFAGGDTGGILSYASNEGTDIANYVSTVSSELSSSSLSLSTLAPAFAAVLWTGLVTCGYTIYAQSFGQSRVNPTDANLIYTIQPIFTALFAWGLLGESLGPAGYIGGALIGSAVLIVATSEDDNGSSDIEEDKNGTFDSLEEVNGETSFSKIDSPSEVASK